MGIIKKGEPHYHCHVGEVNNLLRRVAPNGFGGEQGSGGGMPYKKTKGYEKRGIVTMNKNAKRHGCTLGQRARMGRERLALWVLSFGWAPVSMKSINGVLITPKKSRN